MNKAKYNTLLSIIRNGAVQPAYRFLHCIFIAFCLILFLFSSCNVTKNISQGEFLLDKVNVEVDNRSVNNNDLLDLVIQQPNEQKFRIFWYNKAGRDSGWIKRIYRRIGEAPIVYNPKFTMQSIAEIRAEMANRGFYYSDVDVLADSTRRKKRISIAYRVTANEPYRIRNNVIDMPELRLDSIIERRARRRTYLTEGAMFDMNLLEEEKAEITGMIRNYGYFTLTGNSLHFLADTVRQTHQVDLTMILTDTVIPRPFHIRHVTVRSGFDPFNNDEFKAVDTVRYNGLTLLYDKTRLMRPKVLREHILIRNRQLFSERISTRTYTYLMSLGSVSRVNIQYQQVDSTLLDCRIDITPSDIHNLQLGLDGTNKAGDFGIAGRISYTHHNIFNGAEALNIRLRGAYEFVSGNANSALTHNFYEAGATVGLTFPNIHLPFVRDFVKQRLNIKTIYEVGFNIQERREYTRNFFNISWKNQWTNNRRTLNQTLALIDINYVMMLRVSDTFQNYLNEQINSLTRYSYNDIFTAGLSYNAVYTNANRRRRQNPYTIRFNAETSGNLLNGISNWINAKKLSSGRHSVLGNPFAQYAKGDISYSQTQRINSKNGFAWHLMGGVAYPYGNSTVTDAFGVRTSIMPFEKRFFSGGPNSVRGWSTRRLGPGSYSGEISNPAIRVGDIKLEASIEYRRRIISWFEVAVFADAGNIWTMFDYENQPGGEFDINRFYNEIAIGTGIGFRLDFNVILLRLDFAKRVYDPARAQNARWTFFSEGLKGNSGVYFAASLLVPKASLRSLI